MFKNFKFPRRLCLGLVYLSLTFSFSNAFASEQAHGHNIPHNHIALFIGAGKETRAGHNDENGFAIGVEYEYRFHEQWGVGGVVEGLGNDTIREVTVLVPVSFHPGGPWRLFAGAGYEFNETKDKPMVRFGLGYEVPVGSGWTIAPEAMADFIDGGKNVYLLGLAFGREF